MTSYDISELNVDIRTLIPTPRDMEILINVLKELTSQASETGDYELAHSFSSCIGETRLRGIIRRLTTNERVQIIDALLPDVEIKSNKSTELVSRILATVPNLAVLSNVIENLNYERFNAPALKKWFGERVALAQAYSELRGEEDLIDIGQNPNLVDEALDRIEDILEHNSQVFKRYGPAVETLPFAFNADLLLASFQEMRTNHELIPEDLVECWSERIKIYSNLGLGVFDSEGLRLMPQELREINQGISRFPTYTIALENVLIRIDFTSPRSPKDNDALGGYHMGRVYIFEKIRTAKEGIDLPDIGWTSTTVATIHELAHVCHTVCMEDFKKISGWINVVDLQFENPFSGKIEQLSPDNFIAGETVQIDGINYVRSMHEEPATFEFPLDISFNNPNNPFGTGYLYRADANFVDDYAKTSPVEDYAQTLLYFLLDRQGLMNSCPAKFEFMNFLYGAIQRSDLI